MRPDVPFAPMLLLGAAIFVQGTGTTTAAPLLQREGTDLIVRAGSGFDGKRFVDGPVILTCSDGKLRDGARPGASSLLLDATGLFVMPGLVDLRSSAALWSGGLNEEREEVTPAWRVVDAVEPHSALMLRALRAGITTIGVSPGSRNVVGGLAGAIKTDERALDERLVSSSVALLLSLGFEPAMGNRTARFQQPWGIKFRRPGNRMGVVAEIRRALHVARDGAGGAGMDPLRDVLGGELPAWFVARTDGDIRTALQLASEMNVRPVLVEAFEAHRHVDALAAASARVILGPHFQHPRALTERVEGRDARAATAALLAERGVEVALATGLDAEPDTLRESAGLAVRHGLPRAQALAAITSMPASFLDASTRLGTFAAGADADLVLLDGDPLSPATRVVGVIVEGHLAWRGPSCPSPEPLP